jgi:hypothetical protein
MPIVASLASPHPLSFFLFYWFLSYFVEYCSLSIFQHAHLLTKALAFFLSFIHISSSTWYTLLVVGKHHTSDECESDIKAQSMKIRNEREGEGRQTRERNYVINSLTIMWIIQIYDFIPAIPTYRIYNCLMVLGSHTDGEIKKAGRGRQNLQIESAEAINFHLRVTLSKKCGRPIFLAWEGRKKGKNII